MKKVEMLEVLQKLGIQLHSSKRAGKDKALGLCALTYMCMISEQEGKNLGKLIF